MAIKKAFKNVNAFFADREGIPTRLIAARQEYVRYMNFYSLLYI